MPNPRDQRIREAYEKHLRACMNRPNSPISERRFDAMMKQFDQQVAAGGKVEANYFYGLSDEEFDKQITLYENNGEELNRIINNYINNKNLVKIPKHVEGVTKGLFAPVTDSSGLRQSFDRDEFKELYAKEQRKIDLTKIKPPVGVTDQMATLACMGFTLADSNIEKTFEMAQKTFGSTIPRNMQNKADGAREAFFSNMIAIDDQRGNMHFTRLVVNQARSNTMSALKAFSNGNKKPLANAIYETFVQCHDRIAESRSKDDALYYYCIDTMKQCLDALNESKLIDEIFVDPKKVEMYELLSKEAEFYDDYHKTKDALWEAAIAHLFDENSINHEQDPSLPEEKPMNDPEIAKLYQRYAAMEYIRLMSSSDLEIYKSALGVSGDQLYTKENCLKRPFSIYESLSAKQKDIFVEAVIDKVIKPNKRYQTISERNWHDFTEEFANCTDYEVPTYNYEMVYPEMIKLLEKIKKDNIEDPVYKDVIADIDEMLALDKKLNENGTPSLEVLKQNIPAHFKKIDDALGVVGDPLMDKVRLGDLAAIDLYQQIGNYRVSLGKTAEKIDKTIEYHKHKQEIIDEFAKKGGDISILQNGGRVNTEIEDRLLEETKLPKDYVGQIAKSYGLSLAEYASKVEDNAKAKGLSKAQYLEVEHYKALFKENQKLIKRVFPNNPELLVDDIDKYVNPETIAMHKQAVQKAAEEKVFEKQADALGVPDMLKRNYMFMRPRRSAADAEKLKKMDELIGQNSPEADELRKALIVDWTNKIVDIDANKVTFDGNFADVAKYCMDNMDVLEVGVEYPNMQANFLADCGFDISKEQRENLKKISDKGVVLGGIARAYKELMETELFLTIPFDKFNQDSFAVLLNSFDDKQTAEVAPVFGFMGGSNTLSKNHFEEPDKKISMEDLENKRPTAAELISGFQNAKKGLDDLSKVNPDIADLPQIIESVNKSLEILDKGDAFTPQNAEALYMHLSETLRLTRHANNIAPAENIVNMLKGCCGKRFNFDSCMEVWSDEIAKDYYDNLDISPEEQRSRDLFEKGLKITDELYAEVKALEDKEEQCKKDKTSLSKEESFELHVKRSIWNARDELTGYAGRDELDMAKLKPMLAQVVFGMDYYNSPNRDKLSAEHYDAYIRQMADSPAFDNAVKNMTPAELNAFLAKRDIGPEFIRKEKDNSLENDSVKEGLRHGIATKFIQAKLGAMQGCKNAEVRAKAAEILSKEGRFESAVKDLRNSRFFRDMFDKPDVSIEDLTHVVNQSPKTLLKALQGTYENSLKGDMDIFEVQHYIKDHAPNSEKVKNSFFDKWIVEGHSLSEFNTNNPHNLRAERSGLVSLTVSKMLEQGYSFENIMDPDVLKEERAAAFSEVARLAFDNSEESRKKIGKLYALGAKTGLDYMAKLVDSADLSDPKCFMKKGNCIINTVNNFVTDCKQEIEHSNQIRSFAEEEFGGPQGYVQHAMVQACMSELIKDTYNAALDANALQYGCNNKSKIGVEYSKFVKDVMKSKFEREAFMKAKKLNPKKNVLGIAEVVSRDRKDLLLVNDIIVNQDIVQPLKAVLDDPVASKELGKMYLSGKLDKSYKIKENTQKESKNLFDLPDFKKSLNSLPKEAVQKGAAL